MTPEEIVQLAEYYQNAPPEERRQSFERHGLSDLFARYCLGDESVISEAYERLRKLES